MCAWPAPCFWWSLSRSTKSGEKRSVREAAGATHRTVKYADTWIPYGKRGKPLPSQTGRLFLWVQQSGATHWQATSQRPCGLLASRTSRSSTTHVLSRDCLAAIVNADDDDESSTQRPQAIGVTAEAAAGVRSAARFSIDQAAGRSERTPRPGSRTSILMARPPLPSPAAVALGASATDFTAAERHYSVPPALTAGLVFHQLVREVVLGEYVRQQSIQRLLEGGRGRTLIDGELRDTN
jgi:hypothetical protein